MAVSGGVYPMDHAMQYSGECKCLTYSFLAFQDFCLFLVSTGHGLCGAIGAIQQCKTATENMLHGLDCLNGNNWPRWSSIAVS